MTARLIGLAATLTLVGVVPSHAASEEYLINLGGDFISICEGEDIEDTGITAPANINGVCFSVPNNKVRVRIEFADTVFGENVGFYWEWRNAAGEVIVDPNDIDDVTGEPTAIWGSGCSPHTASFIPAGAKTMKIWIDQVLGPVLDCDPTGGSLGIGLTGSVTATFS